MCTFYTTIQSEVCINRAEFCPSPVFFLWKRNKIVTDYNLVWNFTALLILSENPASGSIQVMIRMEGEGSEYYLR
jgi:hypothetical protein